MGGEKRMVKAKKDGWRKGIWEGTKSFAAGMKDFCGC
jgi:hypothetical protein